MFAIGTIPLIRHLHGSAKQVWYADDSAAAGSLKEIRQWWDKLVHEGPKFGYFANPKKTHLLVKPHLLHEAELIFQGTEIKVTTSGQRYLGSAIGEKQFVDEYVREKVEAWKKELLVLICIAESQPHAAFAGLIHGLIGKWCFLCRSTPDISHILDSLEDLIQTKFLPKITGQGPPSSTTRNLFALPACLGGLGVVDPAKESLRHYEASVAITTPLVDVIVRQDPQFPLDTHLNQLDLRAEAKSSHHSALMSQSDALMESLSEDMKRSVELASQKGASIWLTALPIAEHGFSLHKSAFRDALALRYGWQPDHLPLECVCGSDFTVDHALSCPRGGFTIQRHNELRDVTAQLLTEVCHDVMIEPDLQPLTGETFQHKTAITTDEARLDIRAGGFWGTRSERAYFDVRVFNPQAKSHKNKAIPTLFSQTERLKRRSYDQRVREVEQGTFTPLIFSASGGMGKAATVTYKRLASLLATKWSEPYSSVLCWMRCLLNFSLLRSAISCLRGSRSSSFFLPSSTTMVIRESRLNIRD